MTLRLDAPTMASFVTPTGWTKATQAIFTARYYHTLIGIRQLRRRLAEESPRCLEESEFDASFDALSSVSADVQQRVLSHPSTGFWVDVAWNLINRRAHERFPDVHLIPHLRELTRFAVAALLLAGRGQHAGIVRTDPAGRLTLPGTGMSLAYGPPCTRTRLSIDDGQLTAGRSNGRPPPEERIIRLACGAELNWLDHDLRLGRRVDYTFAHLDDSAAPQWRDELNRHFSTIAGAYEPLADEMARGVTSIVPILSPDPALHISGSFREAPGMIAMSLGLRQATLEALVHEFGHQKLYAILLLDPLIVGDTGEAVHFSPWRDDLRPLSGLLQATYTFVMVLDFYRALLDSPQAGDFDGAALVERAYQVGRQVGQGITELRAQATFSPLGHALIAAMAGRLAECADQLPSPPAETRRSIDTAQANHRARWSERYARLRRATATRPDTAVNPSSTPNTDAKTLRSLGMPRATSTRPDTDVETLLALGMPPDWTLDAIVGRWYPGDFLLESVRNARLPHHDPLPASPPGKSLVADLAAAHLAYVRDDYTTAAQRYSACVGHDPHSPYFWQCYAFTLRHLGRHEEALYILTHISALMAERRTPVPSEDLRATSEALTWGLTLPAAEPEQASRGEDPLPPLPFGDPVAERLRSSRYGSFVEATLGGCQLPALIAVERGIKPAMDTWIPPEGWQAFLRSAQRLKLEYHVDACFDRHSSQLAEVPPDQLTTTRAAFSATLRPGTEAHVFLARDRAALDRVVGAGWYPLVVDGKVINKHRADHDKFGDTLGYPPCCQEFFRQRNNWNDDNTYYAALLNTKGEPSILCNPFLRHTIYGLVPYMPCSYSCPATMDLAGRLRELIAAELPDYLDAIEQALSKTVLCVSELRMYWFGNETVTRADGTVSITYNGVESLYQVESSDPLRALLASGDRCDLDGTVLLVYRGDTYIGGYQTRGDRHGPECPFVISFTR